MYKQDPVPRRVSAAEVLDLARSGSLSISLAEEALTGPKGLSRTVYDLVWPIVFDRITRRAEFSRGHTACARSVKLLDGDCLDRFHDDVAAVLDVVRRRATGRIDDLERWIGGVARSATIDGHRRRRGELGALQRPRPPRWLCDALSNDPWLVSLALRVLEWAGVPDAPSSGVWPLSRWSEQRALATGDWEGSTPRVVLAEVERVLTCMRTEKRWYHDYVERPIGRKTAPTSSGSGLRPLPLSGSHDAEECRLRSKAHATILEISTRTWAGENPSDAALDALRRHFCSDPVSSMITEVPHCSAHAQDWLNERLGDGEAALMLASAVAVDVVAGLGRTALSASAAGGDDALVAASR
ncbi:hypothetical protein SAMN05216188_117104 [Lentzea xinjiangensis]|uniref:Uncharacterized protein n=1 Tax=Lentzea xinjiangensis TaxID=402600 RepID=A0A1H9T1S7_9PSEU|nr:hypothetical protein [Lentzea xinjiangensis]SER91195.1 hypothetical protein SAMN05216188_117104 [Lentzea xinjiangensis]